MKIRYIVIGTMISLLIGIGIIVLSFEQFLRNHQRICLKDDPITPVVGKTTTPVGNYLIIARILVLMGAGIYNLICFKKRKK